jgi:gamma-glutamyltranspeptidase
MPNRIVVCPEPLAAAAGAAIFRAGGSAVDAALCSLLRIASRVTGSGYHFSIRTLL